MKIRGIISFAFILVVLAMPAIAQIQSPPGVPSSDGAVSPATKEEEVKEFFSGYVDRYVRKDIDGFLAFFSSKATQNQKETLPEIRKIYVTFFEQSHEVKYQLHDTKIEIYENGVEVKGRYEITQTLRRGGEKRAWKGNATWFLVKEDGGLRILYLNYQHQKAL